MRRTPDERSAWLRERLLEALVVNGGELPLTPLRWFAFGGEQVWSDERTQALIELEAMGLIAARTVPRVVGRHGGGTVLYRARTMSTVPGNGGRYVGAVAALDLAPADKVRLLDCVHSQLVVARARDDAEAAAAWLRVSATLVAGEMFGDDKAIDGEPGAAEAAS
jgi:hypothetical protein